MACSSSRRRRRGAGGRARSRCRSPRRGRGGRAEINAELFEAVLSRTRTRGPARLLLAAMAALADEDGVVRGVSSEELCGAAGVADQTYRRARKELLESGELVLVSGAGGRGNTNVWEVRPSGGIAPAARSRAAAAARGASRRGAAPARRASRPRLATRPTRRRRAGGFRRAR